jgi:hypothetical protein
MGLKELDAGNENFIPGERRILSAVKQEKMGVLRTPIWSFAEAA